jgi:transposase
MRAVSLDLKARIPVLRFEQNLTVEEICKVLGVRKSLVYKTLEYQESSRHIYNILSRSTGRRRTLTHEDIEFLQGVIAHQNTIYLDELQARLQLQRGIDISASTLSRTLCRIHLSRKRVSRQAIERSTLL